MHVTVSTTHYHISIQDLGGLDHEFESNEHLSGISSVGPYPPTSMNYANAFPPERHSSAMPVGPGYDVPPHLATVGVCLPIFIPLR